MANNMEVKRKYFLINGRWFMKMASPGKIKKSDTTAINSDVTMFETWSILNKIDRIK
jgi:hypothetical protein